ncbi:hypothetical protein DFR41_103378 [Pseudacidovorax intermedius]|uniref:Polyketide cyclase n=1 Tax=Pseudacidovorax intermedius TaxID=433924 RepID=A0A370FIR4_9BURK|nr:nuclear transport factor 2 family protein [Pseudacidovorax intermedius]RDI26221.1 hypothetical protein DFR41_103378 [Pseudacidovorax intermedius]
MDTLNLPAPIAAYFAADPETEALAHCFTAQAVLKDEGHTYTGARAIQTFMADASAKYNATAVPFALEQEDGSHVVRATVTGNFPGSPIVLSYRFRLAGALIASLEITS